MTRFSRIFSSFAVTKKTRGWSGGQPSVGSDVRNSERVSATANRESLLSMGANGNRIRCTTKEWLVHIGAGERVCREVTYILRWRHAVSQDM
jgi:hypothetical protein